MVQRILVADDDPRLANMVAGFLKQQGYELDLTEDGVSALARMGSFKPDVLITDVRMPSLDGFALLQQVQENFPNCAVVVMTGYGSVEDAVRAKQYGALHYLQKPFAPEDLLNILERLKKGARPSKSKEGEQFPEIVGESPAMREVFSRILQIANTDLSVLIQGETGTGKELVSGAIHRLSFRNSGRFVIVNCATLEHDLFESELFGHAAGAFTGATRAKEGLLEAASGGTLVLDEVGEISKKTQAKLLRAIETGEIRRLGETKTRTIDTRVVAATNVPLRQAAARGDFRSDLFFRLAAFTIVIPPLRNRRSDIPLLARALLRRTATADRRSSLDISDSGMNKLMSYDWPGNVRELMNIIRASAVTALNQQESVIDTSHIFLPRSSDYGMGGGSAPAKFVSDTPATPVAATPVAATPVAATPLESYAPPAPTTANLREVPATANTSPELAAFDFDQSENYRTLRDELIRRFDRHYFSKLLTKTSGNISKAARISGLDRKRLREKLHDAGLSADDFR